MTKEQLIKTAEKLVQPSSESAAEFLQKSEHLATSMNNRFLLRKDLTHLIGEGNEDMMKDNHRNHIRFLSSVFLNYDPEVLVETVLWVFRAYRAHGFKLTYWPAQLDTWVDIFKVELSENCFHEIYPFYHWMIVNNPIFSKLSDEILLGSQELKISLHN